MDLETLVSVCGGSTNDRKITCETLADIAPDNTGAASTEDVPPDLPPESFWLSKDAEFDWFDRNAFLERKESTKGINSNSATNNSTNPNHSASNTQKFVSKLTSKAGILGLPKTQKTNYVADAKRRQCRAANIKLFPKRPDSAGKTTAIPMAEPSSPKVSCMGRVRSKRGRRKPAGPVPELQSKKPELQPSKSTKKKSKQPAVVVDQIDNKSEKKSGILYRLTLIFGSNGQRRRKMKRLSSVNERSEESGPRKSVTVNKAPGEPPGLGAMNRFVSGRRSDAFGAEADMVVRDSFDGLGAMTRFVSGRRSDAFGEEADLASRHSFDLGRRGV